MQCSAVPHASPCLCHCGAGWDPHPGTSPCPSFPLGHMSSSATRPPARTVRVFMKDWGCSLGLPPPVGCDCRYGTLGMRFCALGPPPFRYKVEVGDIDGNQLLDLAVMCYAAGTLVSCDGVWRCVPWWCCLPPPVSMTILLLLSPAVVASADHAHKVGPACRLHNVRWNHCNRPWRS